MNPAKSNSQNSSTSKQTDSSVVFPQIISSSATISKEHEVGVLIPTEAIQSVSTEVEIHPEVEKAGVTTLRDTIELPPDVKKMGVTPVGSSTPVATTTTLPRVLLPISDDQVVAGLHVHVINAFRWLAVWCIKKLKKAHIALKVIHGKIVRVRT